jgi:hypothetical protein
MKKLTIIALLTLSTQSFASFSVSNTVAYTLAEAIYSTAIPVASTGATTAASEQRNKEALELKNDIQDFFQSGNLTLSLQNKIKIAQELDSSLSQVEAIDLLLEVTNL